MISDIWSGDIALSDHEVIKDIVFAAQNLALSSAFSDVSLRFLATVYTAHIPLYLAAGPSLDVWTTNECTSQWFQSILLSQADAMPASIAPEPDAQHWWCKARSQSPIGILVQVNGHVPGKGENNVTEILFYGTVATPVSANLPTPPPSSAEALYGNPEHLSELHVHALPLSSERWHIEASSENDNLSHSMGKHDLDIEPQFLPAKNEMVDVPSPKRKKDIFEEANQLRSKKKRHMGESIAAAAAKTNELQSVFRHGRSVSIDTKGYSADSRPTSAHAAISRPQSMRLSRSPSVSSDTRPSSRKESHEMHVKRSTLSQMETVSAASEEPTIESRNKDALSRVVMAAMRMHGLQQRKKTKSRRTSVAPSVKSMEQFNEEITAEEAAKDEEFKLIYHQTYKGAALALRKHMATKSLHFQPDRLRDVVEKLLMIFCTDPLTQPLPLDDTTDILATPGGSNQLKVPGSSHSRASPFDLPSGRALAALKQTHQGPIHTGSPVPKGVEQTDYFGAFE
ncbi:hypothetical protein BU24DRAFT_175371 [Aaosphaeria arxii CBS 175.79]|uniref:Sld7 C-terminal domain-containing protein n=1 Tax=Aaosphaeria arxii CBS 175.79 TaxID=1450172 RepID=A0A6A5XR02_9PLEO|nr:uncharacterized protein BU24DRAFT_175371 [Aaosphaeria arxii CBS 175.79]KAF2015326.1 hypothetical protein BU24DRAFT_175371 [Aaosphaeria arxii CBS 175.79]